MDMHVRSMETRPQKWKKSKPGSYVAHVICKTHAQRFP